MATGELTTELISEGRTLLEGLDKEGAPPDAALWFYFPAPREWKLLLEVRLGPEGQRGLNRKIQKTLSGSGQRIATLKLEDIMLASPDAPMIRVLRGVVSTESEIVGLRFTRNVINGIFVEDAYIYRLMPAPDTDDLENKPLVLFGAGASFGSESANMPPLGTDLFTALQAADPGSWGLISGAQADAFRKDFEDGMRQLTETNPRSLIQLQCSMAAYFFTHSPSDSSLYRRFARLIRECRWAGAVASLNYDRLIHVALQREGISLCVGALPSPLVGGTEVVWPHGCCNVFCDGVRAPAGTNIFNGLEIETDGPIRVVEDPEEHRLRIRTDAFPPVMSCFLPDKRTISGVSFIAGQRERWATLVRQAPVICVVGVRVRPHDRHIWDPLALTDGKVVYCSRGGREEYEKWRIGNARRNGDVVLEKTFDEAFEELCESLGLTADVSIS